MAPDESIELTVEELRNLVHMLPENQDPKTVLRFERTGQILKLFKNSRIGKAFNQADQMVRYLKRSEVVRHNPWKDFINVITRN